ncbi:MAG: hypothetical protein HZC29_00670 [Thaumarchaeota archaeon]|nr:hypothetical protein [Nitrososphaerota archaeon]
MKSLVIVLICLAIILPQHSEEREISPFSFELNESKGNWIKYSDSQKTEFYGVVQKGATINLPLRIILTANEPTQLNFHATIGDQMGPVKLPRGIHVKIEPDSFVLRPDQEKTMDIIISADKTAPSNVYDIGIVGVWPEPINNFSGTSIRVHVGRDFGHDAVPSNFFPSPIRQMLDEVQVMDVVCVNDYTLIQKKSKPSPACVSQTTKHHLMLRGWTEPDELIARNWWTLIKDSSTNNGKILSIESHPELASMVFKIKSEGDGMLFVVFPEKPTNAKLLPLDSGDFIVLVNGEEADFEEIYDSDKRTLKIKFQDDDDLVEILRSLR